MQKGTKRYSIQEPNKKLKPNCKSGLILITNKTIDKKSSHNPYTQDYAMIFCIVFNWCLVLVGVRG